MKGGGVRKEPVKSFKKKEGACRVEEEEGRLVVETTNTSSGTASLITGHTAGHRTGEKSKPIAEKKASGRTEE